MEASLSPGLQWLAFKLLHCWQRSELYPMLLPAEGSLPAPLSMFLGTCSTHMCSWMRLWSFSQGSSACVAPSVWNPACGTDIGTFLRTLTFTHFMGPQAVKSLRSQALLNSLWFPMLSSHGPWRECSCVPSSGSPWTPSSPSVALLLTRASFYFGLQLSSHLTGQDCAPPTPLFLPSFQVCLCLLGTLPLGHAFGFPM